MTHPVGGGSADDLVPGRGGEYDEGSQSLVAARSQPDRFGEFYDRHFDLVVGFFVRRTASADVAADLTAETFAAALGALHRFRPSRGTARSWLLGIANNIFRQWLRRGYAESRARARLRIVTPNVAGSELERIETALDLGPLLAALPQAVEALSPAVRDALRLRIAEQLPYAEVAKRLGCSELSARVRVSRGLDRLHRELAVT